MCVSASILHSWGDYNGRFATAMLIAILTKVVFTLLSPQGASKRQLCCQVSQQNIPLQLQLITWVCHDPVLYFGVHDRLPSCLCSSLSVSPVFWLNLLLVPARPLLLPVWKHLLCIDRGLYIYVLSQSLPDCFCSHLQILSNLTYWLISCVPDLILPQFSVPVCSLSAL